MGSKNSKIINIGNRMILPKDKFKSAYFVRKNFKNIIVVTTTDDKEQEIVFDLESEAMQALRELDL